MISKILAIAGTEIRLTRRLVRYWVFVVLSYLIAALAYLQFAAIHAFFSSYSATAASIGPRYLVAALGLRYMLIYMVGLVFLGFDLRARDRRERMVEVLDSRPFTNLELVLGRFLGLFAAGWIPVVVLAFLFQAVGLLLPAVGSPIGGTVEPLSLFTFVVVMAIPAFAFTLALVFLVTLVVRNRLIAAVLALALLVGLSWASLRLPLSVEPFFDITGAFLVGFPSDILHIIGGAVFWLQRLAVLLVAVGLLVLAAAMYPRLDGGSRSRSVGVGVALMVVALALMTVGWRMNVGVIDRLHHWEEIHAGRVLDVAPDVTSLTGKVRIDPGKDLELSLDLVFRAPPDEALETALFSLNPGLIVTQAKSADGGDISFIHEDGLLELELPTALGPGEETGVQLEVGGRPNMFFAYLDAAKNIEDSIAWEAQIGLLGYDRGINHSAFVALMPGVHWLPTSGPDVGRGDPQERGRDFFTVDLEVTVPEGWLVGGPGKRTALGTGDHAFRFSPPAPVPEVALMASRFASYSMEVEGVLMEMLLHPGHTENMEVLADAKEEVRSWLAERLADAEEAGLPYPYDALTVVEVPNTLRGFGGGWRLDTVLAPPAMVLMRESAFPTARFDVPFRNPEDFADREGGLPRAKLDRLKAFCVNDFSGGGMFVGAARSFFAYQTSARGPEGLALNFVFEELTTLFLTGSRGYFSAHMFSSELNQAIPRVLGSFFTGRRDRNFAEAVIEAFTSRPEVWSSVTGAALNELEPEKEPQRTLDILALKGGALAQSVVDELGPDGAAALLADLRRKFSGGNFTLADVVSSGAEIDEDLGQLFDDWLTTTELPAFVGSDARSYRLEDGDDGSPRYQLVATVRNDEPVQGLIRMVYYVRAGEEQEDRVETDPIRVGGQSALRWGTVVSRPPTGLWVQPYLSLNRESFRLAMAPLDDEKIVDAEPLEGLEEVPWAIPEVEWIAVDDLDDGFEIVEGDTRSGMRLGAKEVETETDQGLPLEQFGNLPQTWSRASRTTAWGRYRHTAAVMRPRKGKTKAVFSAEIPTAGTWDLEIHLPHKRSFRGNVDWGMWTLELKDDTGSQSLEFNAGEAPRGWNIVGSYEIADGMVAVELSDEGTGRVVVADAIRWLPTIRGSAASDAEEAE